MKIYISIPISGNDYNAQQKAAKQTAAKLRRLGCEPVNPFDTPEAPSGLSEKERYAYYMGEDLKRLLMCDAIFMYPVGWQDSKGCIAEHEIAGIYGLKIFRNLFEVAADIIEEDE